MAGSVFKKAATLIQNHSQFMRAQYSLEICGQVQSVSPNEAVVTDIGHFPYIGDLVHFNDKDRNYQGEIVRLESTSARVRLFENGSHINVGQKAVLFGRHTIFPDERWKGRILNALGNPIDGLGDLDTGFIAYETSGKIIDALQRDSIGARSHTGIRAIDIFSPICSGQRIGIFAGSGVGKSTLLSLMAEPRNFDTIVICLIGERSREVREFIDKFLTERDRNIVAVISTSGEEPAKQRIAAQTATTIAEFFRDRGDRVALIMDSITRLAHSERDISISLGEFPVARGYPPRVLATLSRLVERVGPGRKGEGFITAIYTVLVDGGDLDDPIADHMRGVLDGHIILAREIAEHGRYPAIDCQKTLSRLSGSVLSADEKALVTHLRGLISIYEESHDLLQIGGYSPGSNRNLDEAVRIVPKLYEFLKQSEPDPPNYDVFGALVKHLTI